MDNHGQSWTIIEKERVVVANVGILASSYPELLAFPLFSTCLPTDLFRVIDLLPYMYVDSGDRDHRVQTMREKTIIPSKRRNTTLFAL